MSSPDEDQTKFLPSGTWIVHIVVILNGGETPKSYEASPNDDWVLAPKSGLKIGRCLATSNEQRSLSEIACSMLALFLCRF